MNLSSLLGKTLLLGALTLGLAATAMAQEISLLATENGITINTSLNLGDGHFEIGAPSIINQDIWKPVKPKVELVDDTHQTLHYPNGAEIKVTIAGSKVTFAFSKIPAEATRISTGFSISRDAWQGSRYSFDDKPLVAFPEEDERRVLFEGKAKLFTLVDPAGTGFSLAGPELKFTLSNKGPEGWSQFGCFFSYMLTEHAGETEFTLEFSPVTAP